MAKKTLEPQQARSRESTRKLLKAAAEVLGQHGVEGTTIPRIAQHRGPSIAVSRTRTRCWRLWSSASWSGRNRGCA